MAYKGNKNNSESTYFHNTFDIDKFLNCFEEDDEFFRSIKRYRASYLYYIRKKTIQIFYFAWILFTICQSGKTYSN